MTEAPTEIVELASQWRGDLARAIPDYILKQASQEPGSSGRVFTVGQDIGRTTSAGGRSG